MGDDDDEESLGARMKDRKMFQGWKEEDCKSEGIRCKGILPTGE